MDAISRVRVDSWCWAVRGFKTRSLATAACRAGHVKVNGERAKAAQPVRVGDEVRIRVAGFDRVLVVRQLLVKRVGAEAASAAFDDNSPPAPSPEQVAVAPRRDRGAGRPTKRERREMERLRGREESSEPR
ncbi:MAG: RNA-binding S4 domain-containing protein [Microbacteriaceae bacterium]